MEKKNCKNTFEGYCKAIAAIGKKPERTNDFYSRLCFYTKEPITNIIQLNSILGFTKFESDSIIVKEDMVFFDNIYTTNEDISRIEHKLEEERKEKFLCELVYKLKNKFDYELLYPEDNVNGIVAFENTSKLCDETGVIGYIEESRVDEIAGDLNIYEVILTLPLEKLKSIFSHVK